MKSVFHQPFMPARVNVFKVKYLKFIFTITILLLFSILSHAQSAPQDGIYFIINVATGNALIPVDVGVNSNARVKTFNKGGMQKWSLKKYTSKGKNGKITVIYTIQNVASGFYLRPYFLPDNHEAILSGKDANSNFSINTDGSNFIIKSLKMAGDAMFSKNSGFGDDEPWFGPDEDTDLYRWKFIETE